ncbi:hypothetical protein HPP92_011422 [Vanilla planifolia]|uniref:FH2 domain-containing protein n=1 Tax=Vanilla planifolia TaxID=51239 RepID=A0A835V3H4_VANPL|nr:hypothetical protein HPP92_011684 [Vanilla planifolia]KAG0483338.1 hypothetical protein HPP92_011422 [Vanilla planifolia]
MFTQNSARRRSSAKIAAAVILPVLALLSLSLAFFLHRRRNPWSHSSSSEKARFFPPNYPSSSSDAGTSSSVSDFLYAGIIYGPDGPPGADSPGHISSPELRPLPPLYRHLRQNYGNPDERCSSSEEFYSPRGSSAGKRSDPRNEFPPAAMERCGSCSDTVSTTPSHSSSYVGSCSPPVSLHSLGRSISGTFRYMGFRPPELPPRLPRPVIHSPSNRKPSRLPRFLTQTRMAQLRCQQTRRFPQQLEFSSFSAAKLRSADSFSAPPRPPPPPPPPLPRPGPWDFKQRRPSLSRPSVLVPPKPIETKSTSLHSEKKENCESVEKNEDTPRPKLKPLHWDKLGGSSDREMVWDQLKSSSFQVNEERIESLFVCNTKKETSKQSILTIPKQENRVVLDPKKSHNIAILLRALNITEDMVCTALLEGNTERLGTELLETILRMAPTREEEHKLRESEDDTQVLLGPAERFLKALLDIPFAFKRLDAMLYISNFEFEVNYLKKSFETLELACDELRVAECS